MHDLETQIRSTRPARSDLPALDVETLVRRGRRRTMAVRLSGSVGVLLLIAAAVTVLSTVRPEATIPPLGPGDTGPAWTNTPRTPTVSSEGVISAHPTPGRPAAATGDRPAAPTCPTDAAPDGAATVAIGPDVPRPRCLQVFPGQQLRIVNDTHLGGDPAVGEVVTANLGGYEFTVGPGEFVLLELPVSNYLEPGVHVVTSEYGPAQASIWVLQAPSASLGHSGIIAALIHYADQPTAEHFDDIDLADTVALSRNGEVIATLDRASLADPSAWHLGDDDSALVRLAGADDGQLLATVGDRPTCGGPVSPPAEGLEEFTRLSVQPPHDQGCDGWFAVDLFIDAANTIRGINLDVPSVEDAAR